MISANFLVVVVLGASVTIADSSNATGNSTDPCEGAQHKFQNSRHGSADSDQRLAARVDSSSNYAGHSHVMCESAVSDGEVIQTETEFFVNDVGMQLGMGVTPNWKLGIQPANVLYIKQINGAAPGTATLSIPEAYQKYVKCGGIAGGAKDFAVFGDAMALKLETTSGAKFTAYGFRTDATKNSTLAGETLFSIGGTMTGCKLEIVAELPIPATTASSLTFEVEIGINGPGEQEMRASIEYERVGDELIIYRDIQPNATRITEMMKMATSLVCKNSASKVAGVTVTPSGKTQFTYAVPRANVADCGSIFWDPTVTPLCKKGEVCRTKAKGSTAPSATDSAAKWSPFAAFVSAFFMWSFADSM